MSLEGFRGETSQSAFPRIAWTAEGAEAGRVQPWLQRPLACGRAGPGPRGDGGGGCSSSQCKERGRTAEII